jgi:hypothetical protein
MGGDRVGHRGRSDVRDPQHLLVDATGIPLAVALTGGNRQRDPAGFRCHASVWQVIDQAETMMSIVLSGRLPRSDASGISGERRSRRTL